MRRTMSLNSVGAREIQRALGLQLQGGGQAVGADGVDDDVVHRKTRRRLLELHVLGGGAGQSARLAVGQQIQQVVGADPGFEPSASVARGSGRGGLRRFAFLVNHDA
jgi:hypothetical protein